MYIAYMYIAYIDEVELMHVQIRNGILGHKNKLLCRGWKSKKCLTSDLL